MKKLLSILFSLGTCINICMAHGYTVKGTVVDAGALPVYGALVHQLGTANKTYTDPHGEFSLTVSGDSPVLHVSYILCKHDAPFHSEITVECVYDREGFLPPDFVPVRGFSGFTGQQTVARILVMGK